MIKKIQQLIKKKATPEKIVFASYPKKKVDKKYIDAFWERYFNGKLQKNSDKRKDGCIISSYNSNVKILPLSPTVAVTVRSVSMEVGNSYLEKIKILKTRIKEQKLKRSEIFLADVIDYKIKDGKGYIIERIIPSISVKDLYDYNFEKKKINYYENRYQNEFTKSISKMNKITYNKMLIDLEKALEELRESPILWNKRYEQIIDFHSGNTIIIDYNPNNGKFKFGLIDLKGTHSISF